MDENAAGATITAVSTENATETTVDNDHFEVADGNLKLKADSSLDFEAIEGGMLEVNITASGDGESATHTVTITVNDVNEAPMIAVADGETPDGMPASSTVDENVEGAILGAITLSDPDAGQMHTLTTSDDRFITKQDAEGGWWLALADGVSLDHEAGATVMVTVTVTDDGDPAMSASTDVTITVNDVNEAPVASGTIDNITVTSGKQIDVAIDMTDLFTDPDDGDTTVRWELSENPSWLGLEVEYTHDDDGNEIVIGHLRGEPPVLGDESESSHHVTLTARDSDGAEAETSFYVIVDDGNDAVTGVNLLDDDGNEIFEVEVDENDASGMVLGEITVDDLDDPNHPNGMHQVTVNDPRFEIREADGKIWLALKAGMSLDHEAEDGFVTVRVTAIDINGELNPPAIAELTGSKYKGTLDTETFTVVINDLNDGPEPQAIGNWWVTVDEDIDGDDRVPAGSWLEFSLETEEDGDNHPAFKDTDGDTLTYSISGPTWLEIDEDDGTITNAEGAVPRRGVYRVTVTATDEDGASQSRSFDLNVALSGPREAFDGAGTYTEENEEPSIRVTSEPGYTEGSGEQRVATFTVTDRDQDIPDHLFAISDVEIIRVTGQPNDSNDAAAVEALDSGLDNPATSFNDVLQTGYGQAFRLSEPIKNGNTWTYHVYARDTNRHPTQSTLDQLDHEVVDEIEIRVRVTDGVGETAERTIEVDIENANEKPVAPRQLNDQDTQNALRVGQTQEDKIVVHINLFDVWDDEDDRHDDDDLEYGAETSGGTWIRVKAMGEWGDVKKGPDGETGGDDSDDDLTWGDTTDPDTTDDIEYTDRTVGTAPGDGDMVLIVEIDRTERDNQGDRGGLTLTARDEDGAMGSKTYAINPSDQNVIIDDEESVRISGSPREDGTLVAHFNDNKDPDLGGSAEPVLVFYTWYRVQDGDDNEPGFQDGGATETVIAVTTGNRYRPMQTDVDKKIKVSVSYYEVFQGRITADDGEGGQHTGEGGLTRSESGSTGLEDGGLVATLGGEYTTSRVVANTPDEGRGAFTITADADTLSAEASISDGDYGGAVGSGVITYKWQVSDNGRGGWTDVSEADDPATTDVDEREDAMLTLPNGDGQYYRVVASYPEEARAEDDDAPREEIASHAIRVGNVADTALLASQVPTISGNATPGGTLIINGGGISSVQWQQSAPGAWTDIPGATGTSLDLTAAAHAGATLRAVVTYESRNPLDPPGVQRVVLADWDTGTDGVQPNVAVDGTVGSDLPVAVKTSADPYWIEASVSGTGHTAWASRNETDNSAGLTVSVTHTVPLASLFQDTDTTRLHFTAAGDTDTGLGEDETTTGGAGRTYTFSNDQGVLVLELNSGKLTYVSDKLRGHDGNDNDQDGAGNWLTLNITANDAGGRDPQRDSQADGVVNLRINVAPTDILFERPADDDIAGGGINDDLIVGHADGDAPAEDPDTAEVESANVDTASDRIVRVHLNENEMATGEEVLAVIDVQDQNHVRHPFGTHEVTVVGDERFVITNTGNSVLGDGDGNGSTWELRLKPGASFDFEADDRDGNPRNGITEFTLTLMATDGGGLSTPTPGSLVDRLFNNASGRFYEPITLTIRIEDDISDNADRPPLPGDVPGLKDDETTGPGDDPSNDERDDDGTDDDVDGGHPPPPPGASLGGIIEGFTDNMDFGEIDLLEDYLLTIDDGLDIV